MRTGTESAAAGAAISNGATPLRGIARAWTRSAPSRAGEPLISEAPRPLRPGLTVALCTMARPEFLRRSLASLAAQSRPPDQIVIVDASADDASERAVAAAADEARLSAPIVYVRVARERAGLTRQRNLALSLTERSLVAFFDDDVILDPGCLAELERVYREAEPRAVGVAAHIDGIDARPPAIWRLRRMLGVIPSLEPGRYCRSGMSTPWGFVRQREGTVRGDWLPGYGMMWETALARELGFEESLPGYAQAEDLEFSLRAGRRGELLLACAARVRDDHAPAGRPDAFRLGYMAIYNRFWVHRRGLRDRTPRDVALFGYAWTVDTLLLARHLVFPSRWGMVAGQVAGRTRAAWDLLTSAAANPRKEGSA